MCVMVSAASVVHDVVPEVQSSCTRRSVCHAPDESPLRHSDWRERDQYTPRPQRSAAPIETDDE